MAVESERYEKVTLKAQSEAGVAFYDDEYDYPVGLRFLCEREGELWRNLFLSVEGFRNLRKLVNEFGEKLDEIVKPENETDRRLDDIAERIRRA
jgi:hypothetical protein